MLSSVQEKNSTLRIVIILLAIICLNIELSTKINSINVNHIYTFLLPQSAEKVSPIYFDGNTDLDNFSNKTGSGTLNDPYIIKNLEIDADSIGSGIEIKNTDRYLIIINCTIENSGILSNESNAGIVIDHSININITECFLINNLFGIYLRTSYNNSIMLNTISNSSEDGIRLWGSYSNIISSNNLSFTDGSGIFLLGSSTDNIVSYNIVINSDYGIRMGQSGNNDVFMNSISLANLGCIFEQPVENNIHDNFIDCTDNEFEPPLDPPPDTPILPLILIIIGVSIFIGIFAAGVIKSKRSRKEVQDLSKPIITTENIKRKKKERVEKKKEKPKVKKIKKTKGEDIEIKRGIDFLGGFIRYKVAIKNKSKMIISNLDISLQMTAEHVRVIDIKPNVYKKLDRAKISNMSPRQSVSIDFFLEPMICGSIPVTPLITYLDAYSKPQISAGDSLEVVSKCPLIFNPGEENIARIKELYRNVDFITTKRTFELEYDPRKSFNLLREAIGNWAGKQVSNPIYDSTEPFIAEAYYYNINQNVDPDLGHQEQIIIKVRVDESMKVASLYVGAEKNETVNGVLTNIWQITNERYGNVFGIYFESLHCPFCGTSVECLELDQGLVKCSNCGEKCMKKELKKF